MIGRIRQFAVALALACAATLGSALPAPAALTDVLSTRNSWRIGSDGVLCTAQFRSLDPRLGGMFDRAYDLTCRDAAAPVGSAVAVRGKLDLRGLAAGQRCEAEHMDSVSGVGTVRALGCRNSSGLDFRRYLVRRGPTTYAVEGLAGYDSVLRLALTSLVADRQQPGTVKVAATMVSDPAAFARVQAGALTAGSARTEGYLRNNGGRFAESAEFFDAVASSRGDAVTRADALANQGLQQSNLGNDPAATALFDGAQTLISPRDGVLLRLLRNYRALAALNVRQPDRALAALAAPVPDSSQEADRDALRRGLINEPLSLEINSGSDEARRLRALDSQLTPAERAAILDAQALAIRGNVLRQWGKLAEAEAALRRAAGQIRAVRHGKVTSAAWLLADIGMEQALVLEHRGDRAGAIAAFDKATDLLAQALPQSPAVLSARARKAALLARTGDEAGARTLFRGVVAESAEVPDGGSTLRGLLAPYFAILARSGDAQAAADAFAAAQARQRPGVAQTQAILARQFSEGSDEASALFRLSLARMREIARTEGELADLKALAEQTAVTRDTAVALEQNLAALRAEQTGLQGRLAAYPRYQTLSRSLVDLADLRHQLRVGEAYWQLIDTAEASYALFVTPADARIYRTALDRDRLATEVRSLRDSIARSDQGEVVTDPFDIVRARQLYVGLMAPIQSQLAGVRHLIVEPDGALLQLPLAVLVTDQRGVDDYLARQKRPGADPYDLRGIAWLGRAREISTAVSARSFLDVRAVPPSRARRLYLGLGNNAVPNQRPVIAGSDGCEWPLAAWQAPISAAELKVAEQRFGPQRSQLITGSAFNDAALLTNRELGEFRVLHFATHGLVAAPRPDCPPRPALLTSFGPAGSDGLLSFREIFDLKLDADLVVLSACDTAGLATVAASREAGLSSGGNYALDGLVRAFVGAGARSVVASHWPVPDTYGSTRRLIGGLLGARPNQPVAAALADAQRGLMDDARTSHPFYWAAFIILGDGAKPLLTTNAPVFAAGPAGRRGG
ncbi:CHAT domain-containing protein [Sphingomonas sp. BN140010]|uniref:CHAT domain-containing protein n=1 Tax=Sphingomonas arvum TaxID=2992113 RepID=A0ABT3JBL3_9SPHN|nr:CHAT domain-containing protein [Sphingomonas sp. BN140010]MCW3796195.1 CHAT domain-containing protein [Sphingomonas sp. BN140010]